MSFRLIAFFGLVLVALSACGSEPEQVIMDRRFLTTEQMQDQAAALRAQHEGKVLDYHEWQKGEEVFLTLLSEATDPTSGHRGIFLRHYRLGYPQATLRWTFRDTMQCLPNATGAAAGAVFVENQSPDLRPVVVSASGAEEFLLHYQLSCGGTDVARSLVVIDANSGTPTVQLQGDQTGIHNAHDLVGLPEDSINRLLAVWGR